MWGPCLSLFISWSVYSLFRWGGRLTWPWACNRSGRDPHLMLLVELCFPKRCAEVLLLIFVSVTLFGDRVFVDVIRMEVKTGVLTRKKRPRGTERRTPWETPHRGEVVRRPGQSSKPRGTTDCRPPPGTRRGLEILPQRLRRLRGPADTLV